MAESIRIVAISDTHGKHSKLKIPEGDILIFTGDIDSEYESFEKWVLELPFKYKVLLPGNHDIMKKFPKYDPKSNVVVLYNSCCTIMGITFYGHPWCRVNNTYLQTVFFKPNVPSVDIVMTHTPPLYILDLAWDKISLTNPMCKNCKKKHGTYSHWGSENLRNQIFKTKPKFHVFGHVHDEPGKKKIEDTVFVNASSTLGNRVFSPQIIDYPVSFLENLEFRYLQCTDTFLDSSGRMSKEKTMKWVLTKDNLLMNENKEFLSVDEDNNGVIVVVKENPTRWKYYNDELIYESNTELVLDVDAKNKTRVILWKRLDAKNQKWRFVRE